MNEMELLQWPWMTAQQRMDVARFIEREILSLYRSGTEASCAVAATAEYVRLGFVPRDTKHEALS